MDPETSSTISTLARLRTFDHRSRTADRICGPGGFKVIFTPSAVRYGLAVIGLPGRWSAVRKLPSVKTCCCSGSDRYARKSFAPACFSGVDHGAFSTAYGLSLYRVPSFGYTATRGTFGGACCPNVPGSPLGLPAL